MRRLTLTVAALCCMAIGGAVALAALKRSSNQELGVSDYNVNKTVKEPSRPLIAQILDRCKAASTALPEGEVQADYIVACMQDEGFEFVDDQVSRFGGGTCDNLRRGIDMTDVVECYRPSAHPQDIQKSFVEFKDEQQTRTYDLRTVEVIQPGKFVIAETVLDQPDVMRFNLKVLDTLRSHCGRPDGSYPAPGEVFTLGPADMPVKEIEVRQFDLNNFHYKVASWWLPYRKTMVGNGAGYESYRCQQPWHTEEAEYRDHRNSILNGYPNKVLFDCNHGLQSLFWDDEQQKDYRKVQLRPVQKDTVGARFYYGVCMAVTRKVPYISD